MGEMIGRRDSSELSPKMLEASVNERRADQPRRKRASKACLACRRRKVRCDVAQRGPPCMNCFLDKEDCVVKPRSTKYRVHKRDSISEAPPQIQRNSSTNTSSEHSPRNSGSPTGHGSSSMQDILMGDSSTRLAEEPKDHDFRDRSVGSADRRMSRVTEMKSSPAGLPNGFGGYSSANIFEKAATDLNFEAQSILNTHIMFSYYPFLKIGPMSKLAPQDVNFLEAQGCFRVPTRPMLDEIVQEYFLHIHPILPIINERTFWNMYDNRDPRGPEASQISLLVFHAMLFAASSFVSAATIQKLGFSSNRVARASYYRRARLLFEFDSENDPIIMAQGTLLMSYFSPLRNQSKANTYWLGIAIGFAKQAEAHRYQTKAGISHEERNMLKRLWWCCILRDRILPLGVRKSVHISALDFDFLARKPLVFEDFESEIDASKVYDARTKRALIQRLVALSELATSLTEVIIVLYPEKEAFAHLSQKDPQSAVRACKFELNTWFEKTTVKCLTSPGIAEAHESVLLYTNLMYIYYHSAILALCNHEVLLATTGLALGGGVGTNGLAQIYNTRRQIEDAINGISENLKELVQLKLTKYMPISIVAYAALPLVLHLLDVKLANSPFRTAKKQKRLNIYIESMKALQSQYDVTDGVSEIIGKMVEHISLDQQETQGETPSAHSEADLGSLASKSTDDPSIISDWGDVLLRQPKLYLRLAITMDLSLSKGEFPIDSDFPLFLQSKNRVGAQFPPYSISIDGTKTPGPAYNGLDSTRNFNGGMGSASGDAADPSMTGSYDRHLAFTPNEMMTPGAMDGMNFDPMGLELPMGFEAFDLELSSKRGFDFDFPWSTDNTPFPETA